MRQTLLTVGLLAAPRAAFACPVCFGENDSPMALAMNMGILFMLIIVAGVLGGFASFFIYLIRRANQPPPRLRRSAEALAKAERAAEQEGTV
jgi:hypothetical protein